MPSDASRTLAFAAAVCIGCAAVVSSAAVLLRERRRDNAAVYEATNVLAAAGLAQPGEHLDADDVAARFETIEPIVVELPSGDAPATLYEVRAADGSRSMVVLPISGQGMWSTLRGFVCLRADLETICGLTFYDHGETPGLGARVDDPKWQARWVGRRAYDEAGAVRIEVGKGPAGPPSEDPYVVDGITGATVTSRGVTRLLRFWLGEGGFGPYLQAQRERQP